MVGRAAEMPLKFLGVDLQYSGYINLNQKLLIDRIEEAVIQDKSNSSIVCKVNKTVFFFYKTYFKPKIHKTITSN